MGYILYNNTQQIIIYIFIIVIIAVINNEKENERRYLVAGFRYKRNLDKFSPLQPVLSLSLSLLFCFKWRERTKWKKAAMEPHQLRSLIFFIHGFFLQQIWILTSIICYYLSLNYSPHNIWSIYLLILIMQVDPSKPPSLTWKRKLDFTGKSPESFSFTLTDAWHMVIYINFLTP